MSSEITAVGAAQGSPARTVRGQRLVNLVVRGILRTPLISRKAGARLVTVYAVGRKTGRRYTVPVAYSRDGDDLLIGSPFGWMRNLRTGHPVEIRLRGRRQLADVRVLRDEADVVAAYAIMTADNHTFAKLNGVRIEDGGPREDDLHLAWARGARAARLTPR